MWSWKASYQILVWSILSLSLRSFCTFSQLDLKRNSNLLQHTYYVIDFLVYLLYHKFTIPHPQEFILKLPSYQCHPKDSLNIQHDISLNLDFIRWGHSILTYYCQIVIQHRHPSLGLCPTCLIGSIYSTVFKERENVDSMFYCFGPTRDFNKVCMC